MPELEDIEAQRELLRVYRRNLALYLQQQAEQGGSAYVTPAVANGILDARDQIAQIKAVLRAWGQAVDDHPNDAPANLPQLVHVAEQPSPSLAAPPMLPSGSAIVDPDGLEAYFTDVEHLREAFRQLVSGPTLPKRLLVIHGVGGAGKSSLLRMFRIHARRAGVPIALTSGDEVKSVVDLLAGWCDDLQAAGVRLPTMLKTLARYRGVQTTVERQAEKGSAVAGKLAVKTAEGVAGSVAGAAIGSVFPVIGTVAGAAVGALVGTGGEALSDWLGTFLKRPDIDLLLDPTRQLTDAFLIDIEKAAARQRIVLLLDTFEQLSALEDWARDFVQRLHRNVLLVIGGRAVPAWGRAWPGWLAHARVEELKPMTPEIMRELIARYYATMHGGEPDPAQVKAIISFARGLPVVVTSAVQLWVAYGIEDFHSVKPQIVADLVDRLLEGVPRALVPMLEAAAALRWFNKDILRVVTQQDDVNAVYDELRRFPFIRSRTEGLVLHDTIREIVDEHVRVSDPDRHSALHKRAAQYFEARLTQVSGREAERLELEQLYHWVRADEEAGIHLFQETAEKLLRFHLFNQLRGLLNDATSYPLELQQSQLWREYYSLQDLTLHNPKEAETRYRNLCMHPAAETKLRAYAWSAVANIQRMVRFLFQADGLDQLVRATQESNALLSSEDPRIAINLINLGKGYYKVGRFVAARDPFLKAIAWYREHHEPYGVVGVLATLVQMYALQGDWHRMVDASREALENLPQSPTDSSSIFTSVMVMNAGAVGWCLAGRYADVEQRARQSLEARLRSGDHYLLRVLGELGFAAGLQAKYSDAAEHFQQAIENQRQVLDHEDAVIFNLYAQILLRQGDWVSAEQYLQRNLAAKQTQRQDIYLSEELYVLGRLEECRGSPVPAAELYQQCLQLVWTERIYYQCAALAGLVRVKHAQGHYDAIPALLAEAEALAQQYEYNDHLASLRLTQAQLAWDGALPALGRGFDAALAYFKQALVYALRYNRFLLDEVLWGGGVSTPLKPIIPHCLERTFEGQRMLAALRDWWQSGANDIGIARPDTISPISEGISLLEAERIAREREPGDGTPQRRLVDAIDEMLG